MARTTDDMVKLTVRVPHGRVRMWEIMRTLPSFTVRDVYNRTKIPHVQTVGDYIRSLERGGYLKLAQTGEADAVLYELARDQPEAPRVRRDGSPVGDMGRGQDQMWRTMKMLGQFTAWDIALHGSTDTVKIARNTVRDYLKNLHFAGYLQVLREAKPGHKPGTGELTLYRLLPSMNTGPLAPMVQRTQWVWAPNLRKAVGEPTEARNG